MRDIRTPASSLKFERQTKCPTCQTSFIAETFDLQYGITKGRTTDGYNSGSASAPRFYVVCPQNCEDRVVFSEVSIPALVKRDLMAYYEYSKTQARGRY